MSKARYKVDYEKLSQLMVAAGYDAEGLGKAIANRYGQYSPYTLRNVFKGRNQNQLKASYQLALEEAAKMLKTPLEEFATKDESANLPKSVHSFLVNDKKHGCKGIRKDLAKWLSEKNADGNNRPFQSTTKGMHSYYDRLKTYLAPKGMVTLTSGEVLEICRYLAQTKDYEMPVLVVLALKGYLSIYDLEKQVEAVEFA